ncbi:MAG: fluoride efflux transporter CrcB [Candidatus Gastranaerophilales bacterium]|nr:fluoride efflux transporter CrcB [Candidatus Gastranaerophilales bacterium]
MLNIIAIFIGGGLGSLLRYGVAVLLKSYSFNFPVATLTVNVIGSLILGFIIALFWDKASMHDGIKLAITVGFCGGLTTFSTFSWETFDLIKNGEFLLAFFYAIISVLICIFAVSIGVFLSKYV